MTYRLYKDTIHGFQAAAHSKTMGWMLIRSKCYELNKEVPTMDKVKEIRTLTDKEVLELRKNNSNI